MIHDSVLKFPLTICDRVQSVAMPKGSTIVNVGMQLHGPIMTPMLWVELSAMELMMEMREFVIYGTGHKFIKAYFQKHVGTVMDGQFVWHIYEVTGVGYEPPEVAR